MYVITAEVPGLTREQIDLALEDTAADHPRAGGPIPSASQGTIRFHQVERGRGPFARTFEFAETGRRRPGSPPT